MSKKCPLCGQNKCHIPITSNTSATLFTCMNFHQISTSFCVDSSVEELIDSETREQIYDLIYEKLLREPYYVKDRTRQKWHFYYDPSEGEEYFSREYPQNINMYYELPKYPKTLTEKANRALLNLSILYPNFGQQFTCSREICRAFYDHTKSSDPIVGLTHMLVGLELINQIDYRYMITAEGWKLIDKLHQEDKEINQGFIAMAFKEETKLIREAFRKAIYDCGFTPRVIDEKEHNNQIVPEIFYEIERSKFVVVDVTYQNCGAYYEAGYAQALGKQVIICCRKKEFDDPNTRPHFDISQKSMIVWEDEADLVERLKKRITATVR